MGAAPRGGFSRKESVASTHNARQARWPGVVRQFPVSRATYQELRGRFRVGPEMLYLQRVE